MRRKLSNRRLLPRGRLAWKYKIAQTDALADQGDYSGDNEALLEGIAAAHAARSRTVMESTLQKRLSELSQEHGVAVSQVEFRDFKGV